MIEPKMGQRAPKVAKEKGPSEKQRATAVKDYTLGVGKVVLAWNDLHEKLAQLFSAVSDGERKDVLTKWYETGNDRRQRKLLREAVNGPDRWKATPKAPDDILWLLDRADDLASSRNDAIHAPASLHIGGRGRSEMGAAYFDGNPRAEHLRGKNLLIEFDWCERYAKVLREFTQKLETVIGFPDRYEWPDRPSQPTHKTKR